MALFSASVNLHSDSLFRLTDRNHIYVILSAIFRVRHLVLLVSFVLLIYQTSWIISWSAGAVEYTNCFSAEG